MKDNQLSFEKSVSGRRGHILPACDVAASASLPAELLRAHSPALPELSEPEVIRHFVGLSRKNHGVDSGFYPLGSCTMKYNPKINEDVSSYDGFANTHPLTGCTHSQGNLQLMYDLTTMLAEVTGMDGVSLQPAAGAHGELAGLMVMKAYHLNRGDNKRTKMLIPDNAHGTNPASAVMAGFETVEIKSHPDGNVDLDDLKAHLNDEVAGLMLTNPSTLGLFETNIAKIAELVHDAGGLLYYDGANLNAIMGLVRPGDMGFDVIHLNLHKTFSTPHGGGGPGAGPIGVKAHLLDFLPAPVVIASENGYKMTNDRPLSIGNLRSFYGNFGVLVRAYAYIMALGGSGLRQASELAVLNANYLKHRLKDFLTIAIDRHCMHEFVATGTPQKDKGSSTLDIAKRMIDFGVHPPTIYFPMIIKEAMMFEPTETESKQTLDQFVEIMRQIVKEAEEKPEFLKDAPYHAAVGRLDDTKAARKPVLVWKKQDDL